MKALILGGARSGKSNYAQKMAQESGLTVVVVATAQALDDEMAARIARHQSERPATWQTVEAPLALADALLDHAREGRCVLVDCLTLWLSNLLMQGDDKLRGECVKLLECLSTLPGQLIFVSNEVGLGLVPENALARRFRDEAGRLHQELAARCDQVSFIVAGLPLVLKA